MKKIIFINLLLGALLFSCNNEIEDVFDTSASERVQAMQDECWDVLTSAQNGWVMEYFPHSGLYYGGYNFLVKFGTDGFVTVASELAEDFTRTVESHFSINASAGAVLTFDTYNEYFHVFSDPDLNGGPTYGGDFEFTYVSGNSSQVELKGTKTGNRIMLHALTADQDWTEYLDEIVGLQQDIDDQFFAKYIFAGGSGGEVEFTMDNNYNVLYYPDPDDEYGIAELEAPFIYTTEGIKLYEPIEVNGVEMQNFVWNEASGAFVATESSGTLSGRVSDEFVPYDFYLGTWTLPHGYGNPAVGYPNATVTLVKKERNRSYYMTDLSRQGYDIEIEWNRSTGNLSMTFQYLGAYGSNFAYLCPWDSDLGFFTWGDGIGFDLIYANREDASPILQFVDNGVWGSYIVRSVIIQAFSGTPSSNTSVGWIERIVNFDTMYR